MGYRVYYEFDDGTSKDLLDELYDTEEEARSAALEGMSNYSAGNEVLQMGGHDYSESKIIDYFIDEDEDFLD